MQQTRKPGPQRALVLAGGGAKGSYQVGVWQALQEDAGYYHGCQRRCTERLPVYNGQKQGGRGPLARAGDP